jgi:hypothetical protein
MKREDYKSRWRTAIYCCVDEGSNREDMMAARDDASLITLVMTMGPIEGGKALAAAACEAFADGCAAGICAAETVAASMPVATPEAKDA